MAGTQLRHLLFDNDGILVETEHHYFAATRDVLAEVGVELTREAFIELCLTQSRGAWHLLPPERRERVDELRDERNRRYTQLLRHVDLGLPGVRAVLQGLVGRYRMAVVTSARRIDFETIHQRTGFLRCFETTISADECSETKPSPEGYLKGLQAIAGTPADTLVIEDSKRGLQAATAAGLRCVVIPTDLTRAQDFSQAYAVLDSMAQLPELLARS